MESITEEILTILTRCPLFTGLKEGELADILNGITFQVKTFSRGELIAHAGDELFFQHIVLEGSIKGEMVDFAGKIIKIEDIEPPRPLAPAFLFGSQNKYPVNLSANAQVRILSIPKEAFLKLMQNNALILRNFVNNVSSRGQFLTNKIKYLSFTTIKGKLAQYLLDLSARLQSDQVVMPLSQSQLSELFGVARPSVGRAIGELNQEEIIKTEGKQVEILDKSRLSSLLK